MATAGKETHSPPAAQLPITNDGWLFFFFFNSFLSFFFSSFFFFFSGSKLEPRIRIHCNRPRWTRLRAASSLLPAPLSSFAFPFPERNFNRELNIKKKKRRRRRGRTRRDNNSKENKKTKTKLQCGDTNRWGTIGNELQADGTCCGLLNQNGHLIDWLTTQWVCYYKCYNTQPFITQRIAAHNQSWSPFTRFMTRSSTRRPHVIIASAVK